MEHTKGPWTFGKPKGEEDLVGYVMTPDKKFLIADTYVDYIRGQGLDQEEQTANANLIAAAPELLEALEYLLNDMQLNDVPTNCVQKAQQAINKAKGE